MVHLRGNGLVKIKCTNSIKLLHKILRKLWKHWLSIYYKLCGFFSTQWSKFVLKFRLNSNYILSRSFITISQCMYVDILYNFWIFEDDENSNFNSYYNKLQLAFK